MESSNLTSRLPQMFSERLSPMRNWRGIISEGRMELLVQLKDARSFSAVVVSQPCGQMSKYLTLFQKSRRIFDWLWFSDAETTDRLLDIIFLPGCWHWLFTAETFPVICLAGQGGKWSAYDDRFRDTCSSGHRKVYVCLSRGDISTCTSKEGKS